MMNELDGGKLLTDRRLRKTLWLYLFIYLLEECLLRNAAVSLNWIFLLSLLMDKRMA